MIKKYKTCKKCLKPSILWKDNMCLYCYKHENPYTIKKTSNIKKNEKIKPYSKNTLSKLIRDLDIQFSKYIKLKYSTRGFCTCYTCGQILPIENIQCGHYITRKNYATRWLEENCRPQCQKCNEYESGNTKVFESKLEQEGVLTTILNEKNKILNINIHYLQTLLDFYKNKNNEYA